jgi:membrane-associated protein
MSVFDPQALIQSGGILIVGAIVFAESGLLIGFFLPGDTLLLSAGLFAAQGKLPLGLLLIVTVLAAVIGDNVGYTIGRKSGHRIFKKKDGILFRGEYLDRAEAFYEKHGGKTVTLARFVPIVRTFAPMVAGVGKMDRKKFMFYNIIGAFVWGVGVTLVGYFLGSQIPDIDKYLLPTVLVVTALTFASPLIHVLADKKARKKLVEFSKRQVKRILRYLRLNKEV